MKNWTRFKKIRSYFTFVTLFVILWRCLELYHKLLISRGWPIQVYRFIQVPVHSKTNSCPKFLVLRYFRRLLRLIFLSVAFLRSADLLTVFVLFDRAEYLDFVFDTGRNGASDQEIRVRDWLKKGRKKWIRSIKKGLGRMIYRNLSNLGRTPTLRDWVYKYLLDTRQIL